ncbi:MAG: transglutaminase-like domain-containing protein [Patescibacteria group bacterium]
MRLIQLIVLFIVLALLGTTVTILYQRSQSVNSDTITTQIEEVYQLASGFSDRDKYNPEMVSEFSLERLSSSAGLSGLNETDKYIEEEVAQERQIRLEQEQISYYQSFVTPENTVVRLLARNKTPEQLYSQAVDWVWVPDSVLHGTEEKWLLPETFLSESAELPGNPVSGRVASDCESQAYTLVSLLRAAGIPAENVRVATGKVQFGDTAQGGHAWVELYDLNEQGWFQLEPTSGTRYDLESDSLVESRGLPFDYFKRIEYPVVEVWDYFNDVYFYDMARSTGVAPTEWLTDTFLVDKVPEASEVEYELPQDLKDIQSERIQRFEESLGQEKKEILSQTKQSLQERDVETIRKIRSQIIQQSPNPDNNPTLTTAPTITRQDLSKRSIKIVMLFLVESFAESDSTKSAEMRRSVAEARTLVTESPDLTQEEKQKLNQLLASMERRAETGLSSEQIKKAEELINDIFEN